MRERIKRRRGENDAQLGRVRVVPLGELALLALSLLLEGLPARVVGRHGAGKTAVGWRHRWRGAPGRTAGSTVAQLEVERLREQAEPQTLRLTLGE